MLARCWLSMGALLLVACAGKSDDASGGDGGSGAGPDASQLSACDPLAPSTTLVQLEASQVVAAGQAKDGSLYVIYEQDRLFVGNDQHLVERDVIGSGQSSAQIDLDYTNDDGSLVKVEFIEDDAGTQMAVARGRQESKGIDAGNGEALTLVDATLVATIGASTTKAFEVDFAASLADGRELVVIAPTKLVDYDQFRVFFGPPSAPAERVVSDFGSTRSGQRFAVVVVDGVGADLTYLAGGPSKLNPAGGPSTLSLAGTDYPLSEGPVPAAATYFCFAD